MNGKPDFIIVGTMKGGTTILYDFICEHKDVIKAKQKEIHYFSLYPYKGDEWYFDHFEASENKITGEASPTYFDLASTASIPQSIKTLLPDVKIILIVRDPVERAVSHFFHYCKVNKIKVLEDMDINKFFSLPFEDAVTQTSTTSYYLSDVLSFSSYYRSYLNYNNIFGKDNVLVLTNEELMTEPQVTMDKVHSYLNLDDFKSSKFNQFKYSTGSGIKYLNDNIIKKLATFLYPNYKKFCESSGVAYSPKHCQPEAKNSSVNDENVSQHCLVENDVAVGNDGWLFLEGGANNETQYYKDKLIGKKLIKGWHNLLKSRHTRLSDLGVKYLHIFCPNKLSIYHEYYRGELKGFSHHPLKEFMSYKSDALEYRESIINPIPYFYKSKHDTQLYWKTDTHWTYYGCYCAYQLLCSHLNISPEKGLLKKPFTEGLTTFDLGSKCSPQLREKGRYYTTLINAKRTFANELVLYKEKYNKVDDGGLHVGSNVVFKNPNASNNLKVILFGDSFSEYREHLLTGMLAETVKELHFVWSSSIDYDYIDKNKPDVVITELVERFLTKLPNDSFKLNEFIHSKMKYLKSREYNLR